MNGQVVSEVMQGQRTFDLVVRLKDDARENYDVMRRLPVDLPLGGSVPLESIVKISQSLGPNSIQREKIRRRIVILGGVISSTLLDFFVHPALFWLFGRRSAQRAVEIRAESFEGELPISTT